MVPAEVGRKVAGERGVADVAGVGQVFGTNFLQGLELAAEFAQFFLVALKGPVACRDIAHIQFVRGQNEQAAELVEAAQEGERHRRGQQARKDAVVEIQVSGRRHVATVFLNAGKHLAAAAVDEGAPVGRLARTAFAHRVGDEKIPAVQPALAPPGRDAALLFGGAGVFHPKPPRLDALRFSRPGEFQRGVGDGRIAHVLRDPTLVLLDVAKAIALQVAGRGGAGGGLVELHQPAIAHEHELEQVHEDAFAAAGHARQEQVAGHGNAVRIAVPIDGVKPGETNLPRRFHPLGQPLPAIRFAFRRGNARRDGSSPRYPERGSRA